MPIEQIENQKNLFKYFQDIVDIANHYNINKDMFNQAFFRPSLDLSVKYNEENVFHGNRLPARKVTNYYCSYHYYKDVSDLLISFLKGSRETGC